MAVLVNQKKAVPRPQTASDQRPLTLIEERSLQKRLQELLDERDGVEIEQGITRIARRDKTSLNLEISKLDQLLKKRGVVRAEGNERAEITRQLNEMTEKLHKFPTGIGMPNYTTFSTTVRKHGAKYLRLRQWLDYVNQSPVWANMVSQWKALRRRLEPSDPQIANTAYLFPDNGW